MDEALKAEVTALIAGAVKSVADQVTGVAKTVEGLSATAQQVADLQANVKVVSDTLAKLPPATATAVTVEQVEKLVGEKLAATQAAAATKAQREAFVAEKLKDVPAAYHATLGEDPAKFAEQEQAIRATLKADLEKAGVKAEPVGGGGGGKAAADAPVDTSKLSAYELIGLGVKQSAATPTK
jgi:hypothetical protein